MIFSRVKIVNIIKRIIKRFLNKEPLTSFPDWFDASWYLRKNKDVAEANLDPWQHYIHYGRDEGRSPAENRASAMGCALWRGAQDVVLLRLEYLLSTTDATILEKQHARWELSRWYAWKSDWKLVIELLTPFLHSSSYNIDPILPRLLLVEALCRLKYQTSKSSKISDELSNAVLLQLQSEFSSSPNTALAKCNMLLVYNKAGSDLERLELLNQIWGSYNLDSIGLRNYRYPLSLDNLAPYCNTPARLIKNKNALVSVIIPIYNSVDTLPTVLRSLFVQTWSNIELLLVDDASTDTSLDSINELLLECPSHIRANVIEQKTNRGAYASRNAALAIAKGDFITVHDSDDWSHPQKIELQVSALLSSSAQACISYWVRATDGLLFHHWYLDSWGWVYPNISSLMFKSSVAKELGFWDLVRVNADTEYRERIQAAFGNNSVIEILPNIPLSFGRANVGSLSQNTTTHLATQFMGVRYDYMQAARNWHISRSKISDFYLPKSPENRPFIAPTLILNNNQSTVLVPNYKDLVRLSSFFSAGWYLQRYIYLQTEEVDPFEHFWKHSAEHGLDPGPNFSSSGYIRYCSEESITKNPLCHFLKNSNEKSDFYLDKVLPVWPGGKFKKDKATIMLCGHQCGEKIFGAERSLLDILDALNKIGFNVVVTLPEAMNLEYEKTIIESCSALAVLPYGWWQKGRKPVEDTIGHFSRLIKRFNVVALHANTLVLDEPLRAARLNGVPAVVHVRELPAVDQVLCDTLGCCSKGIITHAAELADLLIANSQKTKSDLHQALFDTNYCDLSVCIVPNTVSMTSLVCISELQACLNNNTLHVGMLSSNIPKKGLVDFEKISLLLKDFSSIELVLVGPETEELHVLMDKQYKGELPDNISYWGYVDEPGVVLKKLDVVINLSHFQESFGRTVLEAMAAARPVVAYEWGALPELIDHGENGFLVPFGDVQAVANYIKLLSKEPMLAHQLGLKGRYKATKHFSMDSVVNCLVDAYNEIKITPINDL